MPRISILVSVYNEEKSIGTRIENLLETDYPPSKREIIVASDGSVDKTVEIARKFEAVQVLEFPENQGKAAVQNKGVAHATSNIVIFTDAETMFARDCLIHLVSSFSDPDVGCVIGNLVYRVKATAVGISEGIYWNLEKEIRRLESELGILATGTGACMAVRKECWRELGLIDDSDFTTPLDIVLQGRKVVFNPRAVAFDVPPSTLYGEIRARIRQTSKNFIGTINRWKVRGWLRHPLVSLGILSHKFLRWLTPFLMLVSFLSSLLLMGQHSIYLAVFLSYLLFFALAIVGLLHGLTGLRLTVTSVALSFCVANLGIGIGVVKGLIGRAPSAWKT